MKPAVAPRKEQRLLLLQPAPRTEPFSALPELLAPGDLLVVNDAATFPASLRTGELEIRLLPKVPGRAEWDAVLFGAGDWRTRTEERPAPPLLRPGAELWFGPDARAEVVDVAALSPRLVTLRFDGDEAAVWRLIYARGRAVQYAYAEREYAPWDVQTIYAARPWAAEMPSAGRPLTGGLLRALRERGVTIAALTHATGLSSTGDARLDAALPLPEFFSIPSETIAAIRNRPGRLIAVGTSVVRALEGQLARRGELRPGLDETDLVLDAGHRLRLVDGILTGIHEMRESHFRLLEAFVPREKLLAALDLGEREDLLLHEFGDSSLIFNERRKGS